MKLIINGEGYFPPSWLTIEVERKPNPKWELYAFNQNTTYLDREDGAEPINLRIHFQGYYEDCGLDETPQNAAWRNIVKKYIGAGIPAP